MDHVVEGIVLSGSLRDRLLDEGRSAFPRECCGLLVGVLEETIAHIAAIHPARNIATEPDRFEIDPGDHIRLLRELRGTGREIIGCYHSHPNGRAEPSPRDREGAFGEGFLWLIVALKKNGNEIHALAEPSTCPPPPWGEAEIALRDFGWGEDGAERDAFGMRQRPPPGSHDAEPSVRRHGSPPSPRGGGGRVCGAEEYDATLRAFELGTRSVREVAIIALLDPSPRPPV